MKDRSFGLVAEFAGSGYFPGHGLRKIEAYHFSIKKRTRFVSPKPEMS